MIDDYRSFIYKSYVTSRQEPLAPENLTGLKNRESRLMQFICNYFPKKREVKILDLGCGHGALIYFAIKMGYHNIYGVDCSPEQVAFAKQLGIDNVQEDDLMNTLNSHPPNSLDVIISYDVIEHFNKNELINFVVEIVRVLKTDGYWIIHIPNGGSIFSNNVLYGDFTHEIAFTATSITQLLKASGFREVKCFEEYPPTNGFKGIVRFLIWKFIRVILKFYLAVETGGGGKESIFSQNFIVVATK
ncbi:class I SAM-dependent methyltransferase [Calothrix rhizosoleniae]|uniref:class I SAM-dependent methyltransferase n=1 Tax=Calothrix rhizosoleniae TaxID=888997 RepID=UPI000B4A2CEE|nr:class I SAM-dependent methyltransferase [Calothrix rhizosoleniae]